MEADCLQKKLGGTFLGKLGGDFGEALGNLFCKFFLQCHQLSAASTLSDAMTVTYHSQQCSLQWISIVGCGPAATAKLVDIGYSLARLIVFQFNVFCVQPIGG